MLTLINTNRMVPPIAPIALDYISTAVRQEGIEVDVVDLCLTDDPRGELTEYFTSHHPQLVGLSFRNVDDCFFPNAQWFVPSLTETVGAVRQLSDAPIVLGGVGFSILPERIVEHTEADFGIRGDGETAVRSLLRQLQGHRDFERVEGLIWRTGGELRSNPPAWATQISIPTSRDAIDNREYFRRGGQGSVETKRGCNRSCLYCADPLAKGTTLRLRNPCEVADEVESLLAQGVDVLHLCDGEFNVPGEHAMAVCEEFIRRRLSDRMRWYTYMTVIPFTQDLARAMRRAGCVGIDFTADSANTHMLETYNHLHRKEDLRAVRRLCRKNDITCMFDLLLGGPGETPDTVAETISFMKEIAPDCVGAPLGVRIYPETPIEAVLAAEGPLETNPNIQRKYAGAVDLLKPTFYVSYALGERPGELIRDLIAGDQRFFAPASDEQTDPSDQVRGDHNYNQNMELVEAISAGSRGAYWDILRQLRTK